MNEARRESADHALCGYDFGAAVADCGTWEVDGDVWSCEVFVETGNEDCSIINFTVWFVPGTSEVSKVDSHS